MLHQPYAIRFGAYILILAASLLGGASESRGDLWTPKRRLPPAERAQPPRAVPKAAPATTPSPGQAALTLTAVVDPDCPQSLSLLHTLATFQAKHSDIPVEALLARLPPRGSRWGAMFVKMTEPGVPLGWNPTKLRRLAPRTLPAVYILDAKGQGVRATGLPPLEELARLARKGNTHEP